VSDARRLRALEDENAKLKRLLAEAIMDNASLKDLLSKKNISARREAGSGCASPGDVGDVRVNLTLYHRRRPKSADAMRYLSIRIGINLAKSLKVLRLPLESVLRSTVANGITEQCLPLHARF